VERARHHAISRVESLFDAIAVVDIDVNVEDAGMDLDEGDEKRRDETRRGRK